MKLVDLHLQICVGDNADWQTYLFAALHNAQEIRAWEVIGGVSTEGKGNPPSTPSAIADGTSSPLLAKADKPKRKYTRRAGKDTPDHSATPRCGTTTSRITDDEGSKLEIRK